VAESKDWALETPGVKRLLAQFPQDITKKLIICYLRDEIDTEEAKEVLNYLTDRSSITRIINNNPGSALAFEYLYRLKEPEDPIDNYFIDSLSGYHVYLRLKALERSLPCWIGKFIDNKETVLVDNIGSGTGHDMINVLNENHDLTEKVHVRNIDLDEKAIEIGIKKVRRFGLEDSFSFVCEKFQKVNPRKAHIVILVGILCTLPMEICVKILKWSAHYLRPGGIIIYSTNQVIMPAWDPFTDFLMRLAGWHMDYKRDEESASLAERSGLRYVTQFFDDYLHFQCMTVAMLNSKV